MDAFHRQHRYVRNGRRCPCCTSDTKPEGNRMARARLRAETRTEVADDAEADDVDPDTALRMPRGDVTHHRGRIRHAR